MKQSDLEIKAHVETVVIPTVTGISCRTIASVRLSTEILHGSFVPAGSMLADAQVTARKSLAEHVYGQTWREMEPIIYDIKRLATAPNRHEVEAIVDGIFKAFGRDVRS